MGAYEDLSAAWDEWQKATLYKTWAKQNPGELAKLTIYRGGGPKPILATATGRALVDETSAWLATAPVDPPVAHDFTISPQAPLVGQPVTFAVIDPRSGVAYSWDRTADGQADHQGVSFTYTYTGAGTKTVTLLVDGQPAKTKTVTVSASTPTPPSGAIAKPTYEYMLTCGYRAAQDEASSNFQACWIGGPDGEGSYHIDREVSDTFAGALMYKPLAPWPDRPAAGNWGRAWNFHNSPAEKPQWQGLVAGWSLPNDPPARSPGNSAFAIDHYDGFWWLNVDDNETSGGKKVYQLAPCELDKRVTIGVKATWGRVDGTTARAGSVKVSIDDKYVLDLPRCNTMWLFRLPDGTTFAQRYMEMWCGHYTQDIKPGVTLSAQVAWPFLGNTPAEALAKKTGGENGVWALSNIPIPGKDHSSGPATAKAITSWTSADLVLPAGWA